MPTEVCVSCHEPLVIEIDYESEDEGAGKAVALSQEQVMDDVELRCGCHYHWECLLDNYTVLECSNCSQDVSSVSPEGKHRVLCIVRNEGGTQEDFDILPPALEEAYFKSKPEERRGNAFLEFCKDGDTDAIVNLVQDKDEDDEEDEDEEMRDGNDDVLRYQDSFRRSMDSGLHIAISYGQEATIWLLLYLASSLEEKSFPVCIQKALQTAGLTTRDRRPQPDIRNLLDSRGRTAFDIATDQHDPRLEELLRTNALTTAGG